nr:hypothetical protein [Calothrix sp. FACHB-1219]
MDAEGDLAQALETYAAGKLRSGNGNSTQQDLVIDSFITEGKVGDKSPLELFIDSHPDLPQSDRNLISSWHQSFMGLFAITKILADGFELRNWLTDKYYIVKPNNAQILQETSRFKEGEILLTRISPVTDSYWTFFSNYTIMGKLGKPKLAVAIGNFKEEYKNHLYSDAPDLLAEAWQSVVQYNQQFVEFFGKDEITLPGYQLNKKIAEFQELITEKYLAATGIDTSKPLNELVKEAGIDEEEIKAAVQEMGADANVASEIFKNNGSSKMVMPKVDLPAELKKAEQVTAISHPRWGQMFLPTYSKVKTILSTADWQNIEGAQKLIRFYLEDKSINAFIWYRLAQEYPHTLENVLQIVLQRSDFQLSRDLDSLLQEFNKPLEPDLPEIASVPLHLHNLFQAALGEVQKSKPQGKVQKKVAKGFK